MIDRNTGRSRGFGFVIFKDRESLDEAVRKMHDTDCEGRPISVRHAIPQEQTAPGTPAAALAAGRRFDRYERGGARVDRGPYRGGGGYDRGYDRRVYDRERGGGGYDRGYDRGYRGGGGYERGGYHYDRGYPQSGYASNPPPGGPPALLPTGQHGTAGIASCIPFPPFPPNSHVPPVVGVSGMALCGDRLMAGLHRAITI